MGVTPRNTWEQESGQVLLNKRRTWQALNLCKFINTQFYMRLINGDKDTFRFAWMATNTPYYMMETVLSPLGMLDSRGKFCGECCL